jgi:Ribosomal protein L11 methylase
MSKSKIYNKTFYASMNETHQRSNLTSAMEIVPYVLNIFPNTKSVIDFGCGSGTFLSIYKKNGVHEIKGLDGEWVDKDNLLIDNDSFQSINLEQIKNVKFEHKYDIAMSLEVAEHIDKRYADDIVDALTRASDVIIFGAAIPGQGGAEHVNEQWQSYWVKKFKDKGYCCFDLLRPEFAVNPMVQHYYAQNTFIYVREKKLLDYPEIKEMHSYGVLDYALPDTYNLQKERCDTCWEYKELFFRLLQTIKVIIKKMIGK